VSFRVVKLLVLACACWCAPGLAWGFDLAIGAKVGLTSPWYSGTGYDAWLAGVAERRAQLGLSGGLFVTLGLIDSLFLQPEVFYSRLGGSSGDGSISWEDQSNVLDAHLLVKGRFKAGRTWVCLFGGPALLAEMTHDIRLTDRYGNFATGEWPEEIIRVPVFGLVAGAGVEFPAGPLLMSVDARYGLGLESRFTDDSGAGRWYQNEIQLMVGTAIVLAGARPRASRVR
jgi:hypothetical protein